MRRASGIVWVMLLACGGPPPIPPPGKSTVRTISGPTQFDSRSAALFVFSSQYDGTPVTTMYVQVNETDPACSGGSTAPILRWFNIGATRFPPHTFGPGEYRSEPTDGLAPAEALGGYYQESRQTCGLILHVTDARLTLSRFDESAAVGTLEARLDDGTELAGEFMAPSCPLVQTSVTSANEALPICGQQ